MTDQQRADSLRCAGHPQLRTPNIDRLAAEGMRFAQATTASPICIPARASFVTGRYPHNHGIWRNTGELGDGDETFFQILRGGGYLTASIGKPHYYDPRQDARHVREREAYCMPVAWISCTRRWARNLPSTCNRTSPTTG